MTLNEEVRRFLESPMIVVARNGVISSIKVEQGLPTWAINMKKSQVSHFILDTAGANIVEEGNLNRPGANSVRPTGESQDSGFFYKTMEESVHGKCLTYYTISQTGPFQSMYQENGAEPQTYNKHAAQQGQQWSNGQQAGSWEDSSEEQQYGSQSSKAYYFQQQSQQWGQNAGERQHWQQAQQTYGLQGSAEEVIFLDCATPYCSLDAEIDGIGFE